MILLRHIASGTTHTVDSADGYDMAEWESLGALPAGVPAQFAKVVDDAPVLDLELARAPFRARVKALREQAKDGGLTIAGVGRIETDPDSRTNINGAVQMATLLGAAFTIDWRLADNAVASLDSAGMVQVGILVGQHIAACQYRKNELDAEIAAAATLAELEAIDIEADWPA